MSSRMNLAETLFLQRACACCGAYSGPLDGQWSEAIGEAEDELAHQASDLRRRLESFDARSERNIGSLLVPAQKIARRFMAAARDFQFKVRIISGSRTYAEQDALYAIGRTTQLDRKPVTKAEGGESKHNFGIAWDVGLFDTDGRYLDGDQPGDEAAYRRLASFVKPLMSHLEWGGDWEDFPDNPHYQLATGRTAAEIRRLFEKGRPLAG